MRQLLKNIKLFIFENIYTRKIQINNNTAIISFTFDDVPISAAHNGANILETFNTTGTYYVALGMEQVDDDKVDERKFINASDIQSLHGAGHNIGCHTYSHLNFRKNKADFLVEDCNKNTNQLQEIIHSSTIEHFAYPFGAVSPSGKSKLGKKYKTLRTTDHGLNTGLTDMTHLRAVCLYSHSFNKTYIISTINAAIKEKAWLIFYSHDICDQPSEWGMNKEDFKWVVEQCAKTNAEILNIECAYNKIINS